MADTYVTDDRRSGPSISRRTALSLPLGLAGLSAAASAGVAATEPVRGGTMVMIVHPEPSTLAHYAVSAGNLPMIATQVYEGLLTYDWDQKPQPNLAKSWDIAPDGKTITFKLQTGVTFHNGAPFTSADVQYSFMEVLKKVHPTAPVVLAELVAVDTPDPETAIFRLANPAPYMMKAMAARDMPIVCKSVFEGTDLLSTPTANKPIGTGPFKFVSWERGQSLRLDRNEKYWKPGLPYLNRVIARFIPDAGTRSAAMEAGEAHFAGYSAVNYADVARLKQNPILDTTTKGYEMAPALSVLELNSHHPHLGKKEVRQAIAYSIDRSYLALYARVMRASMLEQTGMDYVVTARAKGQTERRIIFGHVLRNALLTVVTMAGVQAGNLIGGSIVVETVFGWPGIGTLAFNALQSRDLNLLLGIFFVSACLVVVVNLVVDLVYVTLDPRIDI